MGSNHQLFVEWGNMWLEQVLWHATQILLLQWRTYFFILLELLAIDRTQLTAITGITSAEGECFAQAKYLSWSNLHPTPGPYEGQWPCSLAPKCDNTKGPSQLHLVWPRPLHSLNFCFSQSCFFSFLFLPQEHSVMNLPHADLCFRVCFPDNLTHDTFQRVTQDRTWNQKYLAFNTARFIVWNHLKI